MINACTFSCDGHQLMGMVHMANADNETSLGLLILNGGPQYRVGPHRQYQRLASCAAEAGISCFRFDWIGEGDSSGEKTLLEMRQSQIAAAIQAFKQAAPQVRYIVLYGLCEGASAALLYHQHIQNCVGAILANPWIEDEKMQAQSQLKNYYGRRLFSKDFWRRVIKGQWHWRTSAQAAKATLKSSLGENKGENLSQAMARAAIDCPSILYVSAEYDDTRQAFDHVLKKDPLWQKARQTGQWQDVFIEASDHIFSTTQSHQRLEEACITYLRTLAHQPAAP